MKFAVSFLVIVAIVATALAQPSSWSKPSYCSNLDCPVFSVVKKTNNYEIRDYPAAYWVPEPFYSFSGVR